MREGQLIKKQMLRTLAAGLVLASIALSFSGCDKPQEFPNRPIDGVIAWGAGGGTDNISRVMVPIAEKALGTPVKLTNKTGATGAIATQTVFDQKADGHTILFHAENPQLYQVLGLSSLSYDDFEPIILSAQGSTVIVVPKDSPLQSYADLIQAAKASPDQLTIGISGIGGQPYVTAALLKKIEGVSFKPVTLDGDGPLITALLGKQLDVSGLAIGAAIQHIRNGDLRALAIMKDSPNPALPSVPHITQLNPAFSQIMKTSGFFYGVWVKKDTPQLAIDKLTAAYKQAFNDPTFQDYAKANGLTLLGVTGKEAKDYAKSWQSQMAWLIYEAGGAKESPEKFGIPKPAR